MRTTRRAIAVITILTLLLSLAGTAAANFPDTSGTRFAAAATRLMRLGIVVGDPDGNFYPSRDVTRAEMVKMVISARGLLHQVTPLMGTAAFPDTASHWASGYIALAKNLGIINGFPDGTFKPQDRVTYVQAAKMLLEATGNGPETGLLWPDNYMSVALAKGMFQGIPTTAANVPAIRGDCAMMTARSIDHIANPGTGRTLAQSVFGLVASLELTPAPVKYTPVGAAVQFTAVPKNAAGQPILGLPIGWMTSNPANASITQTGLFGSPVAGTYTVTVAAGGFVETATVGVFSAAIGLRATPSVAQVTATGSTKVQIAVEIVDASGTRVASNSLAEVTMAHAESNGAVTLNETAKTVEDGLTVFEVTSTTSEDRTDTLEFAAPGLTKTTATVSTVAQVATTIELTADPPAVQANSVTSTEVTARVLDQSGAQMIAGVTPLTFSISGPGTFAGGSVAPRDAVASGGQALVQVFSEQAVPGTILLTVSSPSLPSSTLSILSYLAGTATAIEANVTDNILQACAVGVDANKASLTIRLLDGSGNLTTRNSAVDVLIGLVNGEPLATKGLTASGDLTINAGESVTGEITVRAAAADAGVAGTHLLMVTPSDPALLPVTFPVTVMPGEPASLVVSHPEPVILLVTNPSLTVSVQVLDNAGNPVTTGGIEVHAGWADVDAMNQGKPTINGIFNPPTSPAAVGAVTAGTDPGGVATFNLTCQSYVGDDYRMTFALDDLTVDTGTIVVADKVASQLEIRFAGIGGPTITQLRADYSQVGFMEIKVVDGGGNPLGGWDLTVEFPADGVNVQDVAVELGTLAEPYGDGKISVSTLNNPGDSMHGMAAISFKGATAAESVSVAATAHNLATPLTKSASLRIAKGTVVAGVAVRTAAGGPTDSLDVAGNSVYELKLVPVDNGGNAVPAPGNVAVLVDQVAGLYSTGVDGQFRLQPTATAIPQGTELLIPRGTTGLSVFYVQPTSAEDIEIGIDPSDGAYTAYAFAPASFSYAAGPPEANTVTVTVLDGDGNVVPGLKLEFAATAGTLSSTAATTDSSGKATVVWSAGTGGELTVVAIDALLGSGTLVEQVLLWDTP